MKKTNSRIMAGPIATFPACPPAAESDSIPAGTTRREPGPAEKARRKINQNRDGRTNLGVGKPTSIVTD